jgi:threonine/homoserine/homoserine lactone efflux protein
VFDGQGDGHAGVDLSFYQRIRDRALGREAPGPVLTMTINASLRHGFKAGPLMMLGHALLELALLTLLVAGLGAWLTRDGVKAGLGLGGGALLGLMGLHMVWTARRAADAALAPQVEDARTATHGLMLTGILTSLSNPLWTIWWATIGLNYAALALQKGWLGLGVFYAGHIAADMAWYSLVSGAVAAGRRWCPRWLYVTLMVTCGLLLVGLGGGFIRYGLTLMPE